MTEVSLAGSTAPVSARFLFPFPFLPFTPSLLLLLLLLPSSSSFFVFFPILIRCLFFATWVKSTATPSFSPVQILNIDLAHPYNNRCGNNSRLEERLPLLPCTVPERDSIKREDKIEEGEKNISTLKRIEKEKMKGKARRGRLVCRWFRPTDRQIFDSDFLGQMGITGSAGVAWLVLVSLRARQPPH